MDLATPRCTATRAARARGLTAMEMDLVLGLAGEPLGLPSKERSHSTPLAAKCSGEPQEPRLTARDVHGSVDYDFGAGHELNRFSSFKNHSEERARRSHKQHGFLPMLPRVQRP